MPQYQGVWTLQAQAQAQSNQQWVTDPNFKNTTLLLQADGTGSGSQNNTFLDGSTNNFFITRNGNTTQGSFSPFSQAPGYWSNYFNGGNSYISTTGGSAFNLTGDYTVECWAYPNSWPSVWRVWFMEGCAIDGGTDGVILVTMPGASFVNTGVKLPLNQWSHILVERSGNSAKLYLNGTQIYSVTNSASTTNTAVSIGGISGFSQTFDGYISNFRAVVGTAVYNISGSTISIPTIPLTAVTNTQLLICQSNRFVDNSSSPRTLSVAGAPLPSVQAFGPFAPALQWTPDVVGGSGYFDGSGDYLYLNGQSALAFGSNAFTIEFFIYCSTVSGGAVVYDQRSGSSGAQPMISFDGSGFLQYYTNSSYQITATTAMVAGTWNHVALARSGTSTKLFLNGTQTGSTYSDSTVYVNETNRPLIGANGTNLSNNFSGYISGLRVLNGTAQYTTTFTPPTTPPTAVANTSLLLNYTNAGIYDGKMNTSWETVNSAQVSANPVKNGSGSVYFNGTASQRLLPSQLYPQLTPGTGDFTIECWLYIIGKGATAASAIIDYRPGVNGTYINWVVDFGGYSVGSATAPRLVLYADSAVFMSSASVLPMGQWVHIALCRANSISRMFINGVIDSGPTADTKNYASGGSAGAYRPCIGATDGGDSLYGYIDDFRISRVARYIANFTPPQQALPRQ